MIRDVSPTRREVLRYFAVTPALALAAAPGVRADTPKLIDFAQRLVTADEIAAAGYAGAVVYVSELRPGATFDFKPVTREYADSLRAAGLHVVSNYQYGKPGWPTPSDYTRGYDGGVADAHTALSLHAGAGGPDSAPIYFSVDEDINRATWEAAARQWFQGINSVLGAARTGIYGHANACQWAIDDGLIGSSGTAGFRWAWQTRAWSAGKRTPGVVLYQSVIFAGSDPGALINGVHVDEDEVLAPDFGQWDLAR